MSDLGVRFWGGARTVTGSRHLVSSGRQQLLLECGLFQGHREEAEQINRHFQFKAREVDYCVVSHAHIDHCGNIPNLVKRGFSGPVLMTKGTAALARLLLLDSAHIQESDVKYVNKRRRARGEPAKEPIYTTADAERSLERFQPVAYAKKTRLGKFTVHLHDAGHILGSAVADIEVDGRRILFTGDLGRRKMPIIRDPVQVIEADYLIMEATYGNRLHGDYRDVAARLADVINRVHARGGRVIIPAFAVERSQEIIYTLNRLRQDGVIPRVPVFVDSPLATSVTEVFRNHPQYYDEEALALLNGHNELFDFDGLSYTSSVEESKALNSRTEPCIIISASGMCEAGRVLHHLKHAIGDERNCVLLVSFQAPNTLGARIAERQQRVRIFGEEHELRAEVAIINEFSAHADRQGLLDYVSRMNVNRLKKVFVVHAELEAAEAMVEPLRQLGVREVHVPEVGDEYEL
ncbi:MAG: MBL fold metallo-hydrolase [bacterium]